MHMDVKIDIKITNQKSEKTFEKHARRIDLHNTGHKNIDMQMGQLTQVVQSRNNVVLQGEKRSI